MSRVLALFFLLALSACQPTVHHAVFEGDPLTRGDIENVLDDHEFTGVQYRKLSFSTKITTHNHLLGVRDAYLDLTGQPESVLGGGRLFGFSYTDPWGRCHVHVVSPEVTKRFVILGHEIGHCMYGHWHTKRI